MEQFLRLHPSPSVGFSVPSFLGLNPAKDTYVCEIFLKFTFQILFA